MVIYITDDLHNISVFFNIITIIYCNGQYFTDIHM